MIVQHMVQSMSDIVKEQEVGTFKYQISLLHLPMKEEIQMSDVGTKEVECEDTRYSIESPKRR